jgi:predicted TIM-barrel enzyme
MTPKEKAKALVKKHLTAISEETLDSNNIIMYNAKKCALIAVDEILQLLKILERNYSYYQEVKKEINLL